MAATMFTIDDLPDVTFTVERGSGGDAGLPANWLRLVATRPGIATEEDPEPAPVTVCEIGFAGP
ncbi:hypothetical protein SEA_DELRIO_27 [Gordonia phage DelRio]|nr:hypothetical protein SEA_DELRIO_27 [Gordonia phage DelRio]